MQANTFTATRHSLYLVSINFAWGVSQRESSLSMSFKEPQPRAFHAAVGAGQTLYVWGGYGEVQTATIESFDVPSLTWQQPQTLRGSQLPHNMWGMTVATNGESAYFFGGRTEADNFYNSLFKLDLSTLLCTELGDRKSPNAPKKKDNSAMLYFDQKLVVHGGYNTVEDYLDELHVFDLKTGKWSVRSTTGDSPPPLRGHTLTRISRSRAMVFAGETWEHRVNDTYVLDMEKWHWTKLKISGTKPCSRFHHSTCYITGPLTGQDHPLLLVVGGGRNYLQRFADMWLLDINKGVWSEVTLPDSMRPRGGHTGVVFGSGSDFRVVVLFGGQHGGHLSETTLLLLEHEDGSWKVSRVVKSSELGAPDKELKKKMRKLKFLLQKETGGQTQSTIAGNAITPTAHKGTLSPQTSGTELRKSPIINIKEVQMGRLLGEGGFGAVYEGKWKKRTVAVKVCLGNLIENMSREIEILTSLPTHPNVITFFGAALSDDAISTYIITELASNGSLYNYLHVKKEKPSPDQSFAWALQVASGMEHLHNNDVVHRDLKSANILLSYGLLAKVCDFGTARTMAKTTKTNQAGTFRWMAPEVVEGVEGNINKMCDVFSYGMVVYEVFAHQLPYADIPSGARAGLAVLQGKRPQIPATIPPFLRLLLEACWKEESDQRPQFSAISVAIQTNSFE